MIITAVSWLVIQLFRPRCTSVYTLCRKPKHSGREGRAAEPPVLPMEDSRRDVRVDRAPDAALKPKPAKHNKLHAFMGFRV